MKFSLDNLKIKLSCHLCRYIKYIQCCNCTKYMCYCMEKEDTFDEEDDDICNKFKEGVK